MAMPLLLVVSISVTPPVRVETRAPTAPVGTAWSSVALKVKAVSARTGASLVPVTVMVIARVPVPPLESVARTV